MLNDNQVVMGVGGSRMLNDYEVVMGVGAQKGCIITMDVMELGCAQLQ